MKKRRVRTRRFTTHAFSKVYKARFRHEMDKAGGSIKFWRALGVQAYAAE